MWAFWGGRKYCLETCCLINLNSFSMVEKFSYTCADFFESTVKPVSKNRYIYVADFQKKYFWIINVGKLFVLSVWHMKPNHGRIILVTI